MLFYRLLEENDTILFYTDGIVEAENQFGEQFKKERLIVIFYQSTVTKMWIAFRNRLFILFMN
ncbi:SpoIIE family protein phosphatase [Bacillus alveayuensis]|uniref:SpoIIE family protein phosphatase n=1 Tax=Aeribacillus alveayuensis TaxID=279215 RepID=UPI0009FCCD6B